MSNAFQSDAFQYSPAAFQDAPTSGTARLYITEYANLAETVRGAAQAPLDPPITEQVVTFGSASMQSNAFNATTRFILITTDSICSLVIGSNPTATINSHRLPADSAQFRGVTGGDKLAVISNT